MRKTSEVREILKCAQTYCSEKGLRLTAGRAAVLEQVVVSRRPVKAYDVLQAISQD
jgi:Fe2+ or Zn2+ uptake regulation protein